MPHTGEADDTTTNGDGETGEADGTTANGNGETSVGLYVEGTYNDLVEDVVVDRYKRFVIRPDGGSGYVFIVLIYYLC
jgi:hypothetical protein